MTTPAEAARVLGKMTSEKKKRSSPLNGLKPVKPGSRPRGRPQANYGTCPNCHRRISLLKAGGFRAHKFNGAPCAEKGE